MRKRFLYAIFYLISLLPWWLIYCLSSLGYGVLYYLVQYRKKTSFYNLSICFPDKTMAERTQIAKAFYKNFTDSFFEVIKLISISGKELDKRCIIDAALLNKIAATGQSIQIHSGHFLGWEFANLALGKHFDKTFVGVYQPVQSPFFNYLIKKIRRRFGTVLLSVSAFKSRYHQLLKNVFAVGLLADQNPANPHKAYWVDFFNKKTPIVKGPEKGAVHFDLAVVMGRVIKLKRGFYKVELSPLTTAPKAMPKGSISKMLIYYIEATIQEYPSSYLWTHRRWKHNFIPEQHQKLVL